MARVPAQRTRGLPPCLRRGTLGHRRGGGDDRRRQDAPEGSRPVRRYHLSACAVTVDEETAVLAQLIRKVYEAEPLAYPKCWGSARVIALIDSFRDFHPTRCIKPRGARSSGNAAIMCVCAHIAAELEHMLRRSWQTSRGEETMKRTAIHRQKLPELPIAWRARSEERRVGKECRSRWSPYH